MKQIPFNRPYLSGKEAANFDDLLRSNRFAGPGPFGIICEEKLGALLGNPAVLMTSSCTHALEMTALLSGIGPGDEVIMPSFTFVSMANAFVLRGAVPVFVDIRPGDMNIDPTAIEGAITSKTRALVVMHYAGMACEMDTILALSRKHELILIEDAAHCIGASYKGRPLGTFGDLATFSFHESKNIHCGEGGALVINRPEWLPLARQIREKGTNRPDFIRGEVAFYEWTGVGSSYLLGEPSTAFLAAQLDEVATVTQERKRIFDRYVALLSPLEKAGKLELPNPIVGSEHNGHIFFIKLEDGSSRNQLADFLANRSISAYFHYIPLHASLAGKAFCRFEGTDNFTTKESERLLRLPIYPGLGDADLKYISEAIEVFFQTVD
ncbi:MAG: dTDP-4-amino-4,6-dideoxygalactose transaminase [Saprospiraceae bacterium]|nr:dTDP-4-amino-4,6-dideoxygalactose transaminase [Saprospiraceae bacterium]